MNLEAKEYLQSIAYSNKWLSELTEYEAAHVIDMLNEFAEIKAAIIREQITSLNKELDVFWNGNKSDAQVKKICAEQKSVQFIHWNLSNNIL